jgi:regulatory protein
MDLLARRDHSRLELERKLARGFDTGTVGRVLDGLTREGLLVEPRFVECFIRERFRRGQGPIRIRGELEQRGIDVSDVLAGLAEADCDWRESAAQVRVKRFGGEVPRDFKERARQAKFLQYRGFEADQIRAALDMAGDSD